MAIATHVQLRMKNHVTRVSEAETSVFKETFKSMKAFVKANVELKENCQRANLTRTLHAQLLIKMHLDPLQLQELSVLENDYIGIPRTNNS
jgi:hypothetical protein